VRRLADYEIRNDGQADLDAQLLDLLPHLLPTNPISPNQSQYNPK
jgi:hypothetical protein